MLRRVIESFVKQLNSYNHRWIVNLVLMFNLQLNVNDYKLILKASAYKTNS